MIGDGFKRWRKLRELAKQRQELWKDHEHQPHESWLREMAELDYEIDAINTGIWIERAIKADLGHPYLSDQDKGKYWNDQDNLPTRAPTLTEAGINNIRDQIRADKKASMEMWASMVTALVGVIGALTGLAAVLISLLK